MKVIIHTIMVIHTPANEYNEGAGLAGVLNPIRPLLRKQPVYHYITHYLVLTCDCQAS